MSIFVTLSPIHFFSFLELSIDKFKTTIHIFSFEREIKLPPSSQKQTEASTNNS